jgi:hypothetical protein
MPIDNNSLQMTMSANTKEKLENLSKEDLIAIIVLQSERKECASSYANEEPDEIDGSIEDAVYLQVDFEIDGLLKKQGLRRSDLDALGKKAVKERTLPLSFEKRIWWIKDQVHDLHIIFKEWSEQTAQEHDAETTKRTFEECEAGLKYIEELAAKRQRIQ